MAELETLTGVDFDRRFLELIVPHHEVALDMSVDAFQRAADSRVRLFAEQIRHAQEGQRERFVERLLELGARPGLGVVR